MQRFRYRAFRADLAEIVSSIGRMDRLDLALLLSLLLLVFYPPRYVYISLPLSVLAISAIVLPVLRSKRLLWFSAAILVGAVSILNWHTTDNHKYLLAYWCLAIFCCLSTKDPSHTLAKIARIMIALVFSIAVMQKILSEDYLSSNFFYYELLFDNRFSWLAQHVAGVQEFVNELNLAARRALLNHDSSLLEVRLATSGSVVQLARFITFWNFSLQVIIAIAFLAPNRLWIAKLRHPVLLLFIFSTYAFAPVVGFGWALIIMGLAQLDHSANKTRAIYLFAFITLQLYKFPWNTLFTN